MLTAQIPLASHNEYYTTSSFEFGMTLTFLMNIENTYEIYIGICDFLDALASLEPTQVGRSVGG